MKQETIAGQDYWVSTGHAECSELRMSQDLHDLVQLRLEERATGVLRALDAATQCYWLIALRDGRVEHVECWHDAATLPRSAVNWTADAVLAR